MYFKSFEHTLICIILFLGLYNFLERLIIVYYSAKHNLSECSILNLELHINLYSFRKSSK